MDPCEGAALVRLEQDGVADAVRGALHEPLPVGNQQTVAKQLATGRQPLGGDAPPVHFGVGDRVASGGQGPSTNRTDPVLLLRVEVRGWRPSVDTREQQAAEMEDDHPSGQ